MKETLNNNLAELTKAVDKAILDIDEMETTIEEESERLDARLEGDGATDIYDAIYQDGVEDGKKSEYDAFWDVAQNYGKLETYHMAFSGPLFNDKNFKPKYDMHCYGRCDQMFLYSPITNIKKSIEDAGVILEFSRVTHLYQTFANSETTEIGIIDATGAVSLYGLFHQARRLTNVEKLILKESAYDNVNNIFNQCSALKSIVIDGVIMQNGYNLSHSPLNKQSITNIVNTLSATTTGLTVTLRLDAVNSAFETTPGAADGSTSQEWLTLAATKSNWTISLINS